MNDIAQTLEKLAHALQTKKDDDNKSAGVSTKEIEKKLDTIIKLINNQVIKKLESLETSLGKVEKVSKLEKSPGILEAPKKKETNQPIIPKPSPAVEPLPPIPSPPPAQPGHAPGR